MLLPGMPLPQASADGGAPPDLLLLRGADGQVTDTLMSLPAGESIQMQRGAMQIRLFEAEPVWAIDQNGRVIFGMNAEYRVRVHGEDGSVTRLITKPFERQPVTETDRSAFLRLMREQLAATGAAQPLVDQVLASIEFADNYPAFATLLGGPEGSIWVQRIRAGAEVAAAGADFSAMDVGSPQWDTFDAEGRFLGVLTLPDRFQAVRVQDSQVYGIWRDELDVQYVMVVEVAGGDWNAGVAN